VPRDTHRISLAPICYPTVVFPEIRLIGPGCALAEPLIQVCLPFPKPLSPSTLTGSVPPDDYARVNLIWTLLSQQGAKWSHKSVLVFVSMLLPPPPVPRR